MRIVFTAILIAILSHSAWAAEDLSAKLEDHFRIYIVKPERRSNGDRITVKGDTATIYYWETASKRKPEEVICDAYEYLLVGRTTYGQGAQEAFDKYSSLQKIELTLYDFEFGTKKGDKRAEILPTQKPFEYLRIGIQKDSLAKKGFNRKDVKQLIENHQCSEVGKFIDSVSLKQDYFKGK